MGFVMLGIATLTPTGINAVFGMVAHGVITGMLFFLAGPRALPHPRHRRAGWRHGHHAPPGRGLHPGLHRLLGLPGLAGFWGEILALLAAWNPAPGLSVPCSAPWPWSAWSGPC